MPILRRVPCVVLWLAFCLLAAPSAPAQQRNAGPALATRDRLRDELARLSREGGGSARAEAALIRSRLEGGDFQAGDRIMVWIEGEPQLSDTFTVAAGTMLELPQVGALPLQGVLRSELKDRLQGHLARYLRAPVVEARPLIRLLVEGDVARPGFYAVAPQQPLADVITQAGGLTPRAKATAIRIERGREKIWSGEPLQEALGRGYSLDQLSLRAGDRVLVPARADFARTAGIIGALVAIPVAIYTISRIR